jgi:adenylyltransferase/sulfurtransferase
MRKSILSQLSTEELERYSCQIRLPELGTDGQALLRSKSVLIVGAGGLGSPAAYYLTCAGVGRLGLVDNDQVSLSNLQRQILYDTNNLQEKKVIAASKRLGQLNEKIQIEIKDIRLEAHNAKELCRSFDLILDCSDNLSCRYAINDACLELGLPWIYGGIHRFQAQLAVFKGSPCFRCLFKEDENIELVDCASGGVFGALAGTVGCLQALEAIKFLTGISSPLQGNLGLLDLQSYDLLKIPLTASPDCHCTKTQQEPHPHHAVTTPTKPRPITAREISSETLKQQLDEKTQPILLDVRESKERQGMRFKESLWLPLQELEEAQNHHLLNTDSPIVIYCRSGQRSRRAQELLLSRGFKQVLNLTGGILSWYQKFQDLYLESDLKITHEQETEQELE